MTKNSIKNDLYSQCQAFVDCRLKAIQKTIDEIQESLTSETKSSAGDKHETGRAMLQLEREKAGQQLAEIQKLNQLLPKIDVSNNSEIIGLGSLVYTSQANYFIAISAGELKVNNQSFYAISANTPIAKLLLGKLKNDEIIFRDQEFKIIKIL
ncbi:GreA/GreB family elongation factor [Psychroserpens ponticola]|uniref:GreA/GreB family elongation factor n=1 Tax=Psychroserpens ponticola TaxID=2932268 RepID=A0ABY7RXU3_9FLAO|nr:GreA/GreB family elongation factor [Psychroserpens ponticola]WCO01759.1 GreA/GreB family elongation factor [Psychroserpens ponticola]